MRCLLNGERHCPDARYIVHQKIVCLPFLFPIYVAVYKSVTDLLWGTNFHLNYVWCQRYSCLMQLSGWDEGVQDLNPVSG